MRRGNHAETLDVDDFLLLLEETGGHDFDLMLEIKDKEQSALTAIRVAGADSRLVASID
jgi:UV DNA damage endonuclease